MSTIDIQQFNKRQNWLLGFFLIPSWFLHTIAFPWLITFPSFLCTQIVFEAWSIIFLISWFYSFFFACPDTVSHLLVSSSLSFSEYSIILTQLQVGRYLVSLVQQIHTGITGNMKKNPAGIYLSLQIRQTKTMIQSFFFNNKNASDA